MACDMSISSTDKPNSADHHFEYQRADFSRLRLNIFLLNGGILKVLGLILAKRDRVKVGLQKVALSPIWTKMYLSGNAALWTMSRKRLEREIALPCNCIIYAICVLRKKFPQTFRVKFECNSFPLGTVHILRMHFFL